LQSCFQSTIMCCILTTKLTCYNAYNPLSSALFFHFFKEIILSIFLLISFLDNFTLYCTFIGWVSMPCTRQLLIRDGYCFLFTFHMNSLTVSICKHSVNFSHAFLILAFSAESTCQIGNNRVCISQHYPIISVSSFLSLLETSLLLHCIWTCLIQSFLRAMAGFSNIT